MPEVASQTLDFVGRELNVTLAEARTALENYVEQPDNVNLLERCTQELHQVQGVLRVLEIYGAALLAEEMEQVASYLLATASERKSQAESLDALMRAMVQLPSYLERVLAGGRDLALVLLPLLNDLRAVRGSALLSEGTLLLLNLKSDKQAQPVAASPGEPPLTVEQWARRLRARFQVGLIGWIRGERIEQNLDILAAVAQKLEQIATRQPVFQLWWVTGAVIEALQENGVEGGVSIKRLLGLGDREIRRLYEQGEPRYAQTPAVELLNNLLYYVGRAESSGPRVMAVRASFRLSELLPVDESIEQERENLSAPSVKLMQTVAIAIREDLSKVKDVLDIFVRRGAGQPKELASQVEMLRKIGDTLGVLGLGELRSNVQAETERLDKIVDGTLPADEATLVQIAATLISVEDRLDGQLVGLIRPKNATEPEEEEDNEFQQVQAAVLRECILNLARIKEAITQNVGGTLDAAGLDSWQELMRGLKAGLLMLGKARAVEVIEGVTGQLKRVMQPGGQGLPPGFMDRLADAIVSVEYYMETLQAGRSDPWYMLDNAQACVQALEHQQTPVLPTLPPVEPSAYARTLQISPSAVFGAEADHGSTLVGTSAPLTTTRSNVPPLAETADPELVKLFIEEAHEELAKIRKFFPAWDQNPMERDSLITVRRSFHTLKGSGRMVGARELGEFAWSIENLLNRILDNTLTRSPQIVEVLRDSVNALPELVEQLETGRAPRVDAGSIAARAQAIAAGRPAPAATARAAASPVEPSPGSPSGVSLTGTVAIPNVVPTSAPKSPERATFAQSATASQPVPGFAPDRNSHTQTVVSVRPAATATRPGSMGFSAFAGHARPDGDVEVAAQSLLEQPDLARAEPPAQELASRQISSAESFSSELSIPELARVGPDSPELAGSEWNPQELAAGLDNLDLVLPEEPVVEDPSVAQPQEPLAGGAGVEEPAAMSEPPVRDSSLAQHSSTPPASGWGQPGPDDVLRDIYTRETATHVATVRTYLEREEGMSEPHAIPEEVYRACHTLSGSSKMAQARHGTRLAEPLDHWLRRVFNSGLGLQNQDMALLADCMVAMEAVVSHLDEVTGYFHTHVGLQERIAQAERVLDHRVVEAAQQQTDASMLGEEDELAEDPGDFDPEVAAIFTEEAMELIEFSESALSDWRSDPGSAEYRSALKRPLHTLKGGARMAGITAMGDLSHELETLVMQVDNGSVPTDDAMFDIIQASLDDLARMREAVANGRRVSSARPMIARIHSLSKPRGGAARVSAVPATAPTLQADAPRTPPRAAAPQAPAAPPTPQSFAPPPPALTPAGQEPQTDATSEPQAGAASDAELAMTADAERTAVSHSEPEVTSDSEAQVARMLESRRSDLPDTLIAPLPPFSLDEVGGTDPMSGDLAAELLASYSATPDQAAEEHGSSLEGTGGDAATYDLSADDDGSDAHVAEDSSDADAAAHTVPPGYADLAGHRESTGRGEPAGQGELAGTGAFAAHGESADQGEPAAQGELTGYGGFAGRSESAAHGEPGTHGESAADAEPAAYGESAGRSESTAHGEPAAHGELAAQGEPAGHGEFAGRSEFTAHGEAGTHGESGADGEPAGYGEFAGRSEFTADGEPAAHGESVAQGEPAGHGEFAGRSESAAHGEFVAQGEPAGYGESGAHADAASDHIASDYMTARDSAANEEVASAQPWTPEPTQAQPVLDEPSYSEAAAANDVSSPVGSKPASPHEAAPVVEQAAAAAVARSVSVSLSRPSESRAAEEGLSPPQAVPPGREPVAPAERQEMARVDAELLDQLLNISGEASIARSRLEQQLGSIDFNLGELSRTVTRLKEQLRNLEIETEAQILHRHEDESSHRGDFDPLELDRYSSIQQFSRALAETANDVGSIQQLLENLGKETQNLLQQQARTITELQNGLMRTRMVPFQRHVQRLARIVRQAANDTGKRADLTVEGASGELDRQVLERMLPPFEHMLRNAVVHGIEKPSDRVAAGKPEAGRIVLELHREGAEVMVRLTDDGGGMNLKAIRDKGAALGLIAPGQVLSDEDAMQLILEPGFSTAGTITQQAGRGVGMDVVATEIKRLGGALHMETKPGQGTVFTIRLPFTLAISHALVVRTGDEYYALPLPTVEGVLRLSKAEVLAHLGKDASAFDYGGQKYRFQHLATFVGLEPSPLPEQDVTIPVVLVRAGEHSTGLVADELVGSREIVVKSVGPQISSIRGISGATILGDGRIVIILDIGALVRAEWRGRAQPVPVAPKDKSDKRTFAMVVDDSITVRRVTQRLLERNGMRVLTARDGMDAVTLLQDNIPDVILLDIEMPRMDGYEVAAHVRNDPRLKDVPIIMITSRVGEKHRARAIELGVDDYLGKPYQEAQLLDAIAPLVERRRGPQGSGTFERVSDARV
ncbi:MAG: type pili sensor histidine kinase and response regulator [Gammaproteobacteria bacterium]|nr:type pili sensor histidine kinase and response regulator [Gammaproteobacteria bacterium]